MAKQEEPSSKKGEKDLKRSKRQTKAEYEAKLTRLVNRFEFYYGSDETRLEAWQTLCRDLGKKMGNNIWQCKKNLRRVYVNIYDFIDAMDEGVRVPRHPTLKDLRDYSYQNDKVFPLRRAKDNLLLEGLLKHLSQVRYY